jgi:hypothetical protein
MIDLSRETAVSLGQATRVLPPGRNGRPVHISTLVRAITKGVNGHKLEALRVGKRWVTSVEAIQRWAEAQTPGPDAPPHARSSIVRSSANHRADRRLTELGM